jgi:hypothetical protein
MTDKTEEQLRAKRSKNGKKAFTYFNIRAALDKQACSGLFEWKDACPQLI